MTYEAINKFKENLRSGQICLGPAVSFSDPQVTAALASSSDFIWIDLEHGAMSPEAWNGHLMACRSRNLPAIVRLPGSGASLIKPVLDSGADGIIVPQVRSTEEVRQIVSDCRYPPMGRRGFGPRVPSDYFRDSGPDFVAHANESIFVAVMIETREAYEAIDDIASIPGLDSVVIGPADLSWSLGAEGSMDNPRLLKAIDRIVASAKAHSCLVGCGMGPDANFAYQMARRGAQWLQVGVDCAILGLAFDQIHSSFSRLWTQ